MRESYEYDDTGRTAEIAVDTVTDRLKADAGGIDRVIFNVFKDEDKWYYESLLK